jgi:very-short-patch-repair endonuclease
MNKFELIVKNLSKTNRKNYENYVINAIYSRVGNFELMPVAQQCVVYNGGHYLMDLYFPQINLAIEVDESHHRTQIAADELRTETIISAVNLTANDIKRVDVGPGQTIESVDLQIKEIVTEIKNRINKLPNLKWESGEDKLNRIIKDGILKQNETFTDKKNIEDLLTLFNVHHKVNGSCYFRIDDELYFWSPTLTININGKTYQNESWENILSSDWKEITEKKKTPTKNILTLNNQKGRIRALFAKYKDAFGIECRKFIGVFELYKIDSDQTRHYQKIADEIDISKYFK